jgi:hypothetical protein
MRAADPVVQSPEAVADDVSAARRATPSTRDPFLRIAGVAGLLMAVLGIVINVVLLAPPPDPPNGLDAPIDEVAAYVVEKGDMLTLGHGLRYFAQVLLLLVGAGLHRLVRGAHDGTHRGWAMVGLLATVWIPAVGIVAQSLEGVAVWQAGSLAEQPQLALTLWGSSTFLWNSSIVPFCALMLGFSVAGHVSGAFPRWLVVLGLTATASGFAGGFVTAATAAQGWNVPVAVFFTLLLPWIVGASILMIRGDP